MKAQHSKALDQEHLAYLYQRYAPKILDYVYTKISSYQDAEDIITDVFVAALESSSFAALTEKEQQAWLWRVARNKVVDRYRRLQKSQHIPMLNVSEAWLEDTAPTPEQLSIRQEEGSRLGQLIAQLPAFQQHVLYLRFGENLRCAQIADQTGKQESSIRSLLSRAIKLLRNTYHEHGKGGR